MRQGDTRVAFLGFATVAICCGGHLTAAALTALALGLSFEAVGAAVAATAAAIATALALRKRGAARACAECAPERSSSWRSHPRGTPI